jgi:hypothetical protein
MIIKTDCAGYRVTGYSNGLWGRPSEKLIEGRIAGVVIKMRGTRCPEKRFPSYNFPGGSNITLINTAINLSGDKTGKIIGELERLTGFRIEPRELYGGERYG